MEFMSLRNFLTEFKEATKFLLLLFIVPQFAYGTRTLSNRVERMQADRMEGRCPVDKIHYCFQEAFHHFGLLSSDIRPTCQLYDQFVICFSFVDCGIDRSAEIAAQEYRSFKLNRKEDENEPMELPTSKETFLSIFGHMRRRCSYGCADDTESFCLSRMDAEAKHRNSLLLKELEAQLQQLSLGMETWRTCERVKNTMRRWADFRIHHCDMNSVYCFCRKYQMDFRGLCNLQCSTVKSSAPANSSTYLCLEFIAMFIILYFNI